MWIHHIFQESSSLAPQILCKECQDGNPLTAKHISVIVDNTTVIDMESTMDASVVLYVIIGLYWICEIRFPKKLKNTLEFLHSTMFNCYMPIKPCQ